MVDIGAIDFGGLFGGGGSAPISYGEPYFDPNIGKWVQKDSRGNISVLGSPAQTAPTGGNPLYPGDRNNDGIDDATGLANGVIKVSTDLSWTGYLYAPTNTPVHPNGAPAGADPSPAVPKQAGTWTGYGPKGQGTYYLDGPGGTPGTFIGSTVAPKAATTTSGSGFTTTGSGGGGGPTAPVRDYAGEQAAQNAFEASQAELQRQFQRELAAANNAADMEQAQLNYQLGLQRLALDTQRLGLDTATSQSDLAKTYADVISSYDPLAAAAFFAEGGGDFLNALASGASALSPAALLPGAQALRALRGLGGTPTGTGGTGGTTWPNGTAGTPEAGGGATTPAPPPASTDETGLPGTAFADRIGNQNAPGVGTQYQSPASPGININYDPITGAASGSGYVVPNAFGTATGGYTFTGAGNTTVPYGFEGSAQDLWAAQQWMAMTEAEKAAASPGYGTSGIGLSGTTNPTPIATPVQTAVVPGLSAGESPTTTYEQAIDPATGQYVPRMARGTMQGLTNAPRMMVGDAMRGQPSAGGARPEIIENPTGAPIRVIPFPQARRMMRGLPRFAEGTYGEAWDPYLYTGMGAALASRLNNMTVPQDTVQPAPIGSDFATVAATQPTPATLSPATTTATAPAPVTTTISPDRTYATATAGTSTTTNTAAQPTTTSLSDPALQPAPVTSPVVSPVAGTGAVPQGNVPASGYGVSPMTPEQLGIDPALYPYMQEVLDERLRTQIPNVTSTDISFWDLPEFIRQMYYQGSQRRYGVPAGAVSEYAYKNRLRGLGGGQLQLAV